MSIKVINKSTISDPFYYHREYSHDIPEPKKDSEPKTVLHDIQRVGMVALPFISLYKPLSFPLSLAMGGLRVITCLSQLLATMQHGEARGIAYQALQTAIAVIALTGTIFAHPLGMLITTTHDMLIELYHLLNNLREGKYEQAVLNCANIMNNSLYLGLFLHGGLELGIASLTVQMLIGFYHSYDECKKGKSLEGVGHLLMGLIRSSQLSAQLEALQWKDKIKAVTDNVKNSTPLASTRQIDIKQTANIKKIHSLPLPKDGEPPLIYHSGKSGEFKQTYMQSIKNAKKSILIMSFTFSDEEVIKLLANKADQGVDVTLIVDRHLMGSVVKYSDKFTLLTRLQEEGHFHHKVTVLDQSMVWIGSANMSPDSFTKQNNTMIGFYSREIALAFHQEKEVFQGLRQRSATPFPPLKVGGQEIELLLFPHIPFTAENTPEQALNDYGKKKVIELIDNANKNLRLALCVWTNQELVQAAIRAKTRGVDVQVLLWKEIESGPVPQQLRDAGISVIQKPHLPLMHNKWMIIDEQTFYNGSANWSKSWFTRNDEKCRDLT